MNVGNSKKRSVTEHAAPPYKPPSIPSRSEPFRMTTTQSELYTGRQAPREEFHALHGVINGFIRSSRPTRGRALIDCSSPNMWACAAPALGFTLRGVEVNYPKYVTLLEQMGQGPEKKVPRKLGDRENWLGEVQVVFTDYEALRDYPPRPKKRRKTTSNSRAPYWDQPSWQVPHVLYVTMDRLPLEPPTNWSAISLSLEHCKLGGSTTARWALVAFLPPGHDSCSPYCLLDQPWQPMHTRINALVGGDTVAAPTPQYDGQPLVERDDASGGILSSGLFPHDELSAKVVAPDDRSATKYALRSLTWQELAGLWDVPISMVDAATKSAQFIPIVRELLFSPPAKFLELGGDALLVGVFRGGYEKVSSRRKRNMTEAGAKEDKYDSRKRIKLGMKEGEMGLYEVGVGIVERTEAALEDESRLVVTGVLDEMVSSVEGQIEPKQFTSEPKQPTQWLRTPHELEEFDRKRRLSPVALLPCPMEDTSHLFRSHAAKQDHQKADDAAVPEELWENSLAETFELKFKRPLPDKWKSSLGGFREFGLRWWRRRLVSTYYRWRREHHPVEHSRLAHDKMVYLECEGEEDYKYVWTKQKRSGLGGGQARYKGAHSRLRSTEVGRATVEVALDALVRAAGPYTWDHELKSSTWWEWVSGSTPFFWNWPERYQSDARDGQRHYLLGKFHYFKKPQKGPKEEKDGPLIRKKVTGVRKKGYIEMGTVLSLIHYFYVPKGLDDIRMVYNGTGCGLNDMLWAPHFGLPFVTHTIRSLMPGYLQCDIDIGEMFLNFLLHNDLRALSGVDLTHSRSEEAGDEAWEHTRSDPHERWVRNWMGLRDSPYRSIQMLIRLKFEAYGDRRDRTNPFHWERVLLNLPGSSDYRPDLPWVMKVRFDGHLACEAFVYVDDGRITGFCREICWAAARKLASHCTLMGIQDAARKRTAPSLTPGPWAGTMCWTNEGEVTGMVSQTKWEKTRALIKELKEMINEALDNREGGAVGTTMSRQRLLEIRGYLNYIVRTYSWINPYLKGLHNTIDGWRKNRDEKGWKLSPKEMREKNQQLEEDLMRLRREMEGGVGDLDLGEQDTTSEPDKVAPVERLIRDVNALDELTDTASPPKTSYRAPEGLSAWYCPGDASGKGFGTALIMKGKDLLNEDEGISYESGMWTKEFGEQSSNFREAENLVLRIERLVEEDEGQGREIFLFTDNIVFESTYYKGYSNSEKLSDIILRLHKAQRSGALKLHVIHIAGTRMKDWGVDGLSRGDLLEGMMAGKDPLSYIPMHRGANERSEGTVEEWVRSWWDSSWPSQLTRLTPEMWFELRDVEGPRLWFPPPAAMEVAMEMFNEDRMAHPQNPHVFVVPRLMTHLWRKNLGKDADLMFTVESGVHFWGTSQHEPLIVAIVLPFSYTPNYSGPWVARTTPETRDWARELTSGFKSKRTPNLDSFLQLDRAVREMWKDPEGRSRVILRKFLDWARRFPPVSSSLVR